MNGTRACNSDLAADRSAGVRRLEHADAAREARSHAMWPRRGWRELIRVLKPATRGMVRRRGSDPLEADDLLQEALLRLWVTVNSGTRVDAPRAWVRATMRHIMDDVARGRSVPVGPMRPLPAAFEQVAVQDGAHNEAIVDVSESATQHELLARGRRLLDGLPPPYRQIATLQYLNEWNRREITLWLQSWIPVADETCRGLFRRTHGMLPALLQSPSPRERWPGCFSKKNPWFLTPPPPFARLGD